METLLTGIRVGILGAKLFEKLSPFQSLNRESRLLTLYLVVEVSNIYLF